MALPPLYKYLSVDGATKTLDGKCFRFAKPSEYKDLEDMTTQSLFPDQLEAALAILQDGFVDVIVENPAAAPTCSEKLRPKVAELQKIFRDNPKAAEAVKEGLKKDPDRAGFDIDHWRTRSDALIKDINDHMQNYRVLCVTTDKASDRMWKEYAQKYQGIVLRIEPSVARDSKFQKFAPVTYQEKRPPVFPRTLDYAKEVLFGDQAARIRESMNGIICGKTNAYKFESEYRLAIPVGEGEEDYRVLAYHPEEVTELYLGPATSDEDKESIIAKAKAVNPKIAILQAKRDKKGQITFGKV
jgi:hypothetical protein